MVGSSCAGVDSEPPPHQERGRTLPRDARPPAAEQLEWLQLFNYCAKEALSFSVVVSREMRLSASPGTKPGSPLPPHPDDAAVSSGLSRMSRDAWGCAHTRVLTHIPVGTGILTRACIHTSMHT